MGIEPTRNIKKFHKNLLITFAMTRQCDWRVTNRLFENGRLRKQLATLNSGALQFMTRYGLIRS